MRQKPFVKLESFVLLFYQEEGPSKGYGSSKSDAAETVGKILLEAKKKGPGDRMR